MGAGASAADTKKQLCEAEAEDLQKVVDSLSEEDRKKVRVALAETATAQVEAAVGTSTEKAKGEAKEEVNEEKAKAEAQESKEEGKPEEAVAATMVSMPGGVEVTRQEAVAGIIEKVGARRIRVCVIGGTQFYGKDSEPLVTGLSAALAKEFPETEVAFITGGMPGIQQAFVKNCGAAKNCFSLVTVGQASNYGAGEDIQAGADLPQKREMMGHLGEIYLTVEGGPGVATEALFAHERGAVVVPLIRTGAASAGGFGFPAAALEKPDFASAGDWELLKSQEAKVEDTVQAAAKLIKGFVARVQGQRSTGK